jgi:CheY-like chemotaxis protein
VSKHVDAIREAGDSLRHIIDDILDFSKMEAGQFRLDHQPLMIETMLQRVESILKTAAAAKGLAWRAQGSQTAIGPVMGDAARLEQVLLNLAGNAIKFTQAGTVDLRVVPVDDTAEPPKLRFEVLDTGIGIAPEALVTLFEPFTQADPGITRQFGGTGLGLAISQHLVRQMGGEIRVESLPGRGSRFWFEMSFEKSSRAPGATDEAAATEGEPAVPALPALRVLAVDDNRLNRYTIDRILAREGALVELASDGREAMDRLLAGPDDFDIVLIDVQMPVMDGLSATRAIKANPLLSHLPVVALTAGVLLQQREAAEAAGVDGFVAKPVSRGRLIAALQAGLASRSQRPVRSHAPADGYTFGFAPAPSPP